MKSMPLLCLTIGLNLHACSKPDTHEKTTSKVSSARYKESPKKTRGTNTQKDLPLNLSIADMDADGIGDFLQFAGNTLFVKKTNFEQTHILQSRLKSPIVKLYSGDFLGDGYDQTCALLDNNSLHCYQFRA